MNTSPKLNSSLPVPKEAYGLVSSINGTLLSIQAIWYLFILLTSLICNGFILMTVCVKKKMRAPKNYFMIAFTLVNLMGSLLELPFMVVSHFFKRFFERF